MDRQPIFEPKHVERFWAKIERGSRDSCWPWTGPFTKRPEMRVANGKFIAAQLALALDGRERPAGLGALHSCDNAACCNPAHLRWGTQTENMADRRARGRGLTGERSTKAKLTEQQVRDIRASADTSAELGRRYGVTGWTITQVRERLTWKHI